MNKRTVPLSAVILIVILTALIVFTATYTGCVMWNAAQNDRYGVLSEIDRLVEQYYIGEPDRDRINEWLAYAYLYGLDDKYSSYMSKEAYEDYLADMNGDGAGIGVRVIYDTVNKAINIQRVIEGSPADNAGFKANDKIHSVNGVSLSDMTENEMLSAFAGALGTQYSVGITRGSETLTLNVTVGTFNSPSVAEFMYGDTGVIRIYEFGSNTPKEFSDAIEFVKTNGAVRVVFDLRNNPGGALTSIVSVLDMLLPKGPLVRITDKNGKVLETYSSEESVMLDLPMSVLTNGSTASAAELFTSALKDYNKALSVGEKTYGKGTVQNVFRLSDGSALVLSSYLYCPPYSGNFEGVGIKPDVPCDIPDDVNIYGLSSEDDAQLNAAVNALKSR